MTELSTLNGKKCLTVTSTALEYSTTCFFNSIPIELIIQIFLFLEQSGSLKDTYYFSRVCKKFYYIRYENFNPQIHIKMQNFIFVLMKIEAISTIRVLLKNKKVDFSARNNHVFFWAVQKKYFDIIQTLLIEKKIDPTIHNHYAFRWACKRGEIQVVKLLLNNDKVDPSANDDDALFWALQNKDHGMVNLLLQDRRKTPKMAHLVVQKKLKHLLTIP